MQIGWFAVMTECLYMGFLNGPAPSAFPVWLMHEYNLILFRQLVHL